MTFPSAVSRQVLSTLRKQLIPWASEGSPFILLGAPPHLIGANTIIEQPAKPLPSSHGIGKQMRVQSWPEENLNAMTVPYMGCVVEGEADIITATTTAMCRKLEISGKRWIIQMPQKSFFLTPSMVPVSHGKRHPHWERSHPENAYSRILWMQFQAAGVRCHFCTSDKGKHWSHPFCFIYGSQLYPLAQTLIYEMTEQSSQYVPLVYYLLNTLFHYMIRGLISHPSNSDQVERNRVVPASFNSAENLIRHVTDYVDRNLNSPQLSLELIAEQVHLSPSYLARLFKRQTDATVMAFVTKRRMELARQLVIESQFNIRQIAKYSGYLSTSSFIKVFTRYFDKSPAAYRALHRHEVKNEQ